jgi:hypothetical protein
MRAAGLCRWEGIDGEPLRARYLRPVGRGTERPRRHGQRRAKTMKRTANRWYPVLLLRNALGRFMSLRVTQVRKPRPRRIMRPTIPAVQLGLF